MKGKEKGEERQAAEGKESRKGKGRVREGRGGEEANGH